MEKFNNQYRIPSARANWHDYNGGVYFVTICTKNRVHYFGDCRDAARHVSTETAAKPSAPEIPEPQMQLSTIGQYAHEQFANVKMHYPYSEIPLFVVMPNHIHAVVIIDGENLPYDRGCRDAARHVFTETAARHVSTREPNDAMARIANMQGWLSVVIGGLKSSITRFANQKQIPFAWQIRFHDHIVRNQNELNRIAEYIENNVVNWRSDDCMAL